MLLSHLIADQLIIHVIFFLGGKPDRFLFSKSSVTLLYKILKSYQFITSASIYQNTVLKAL